MTDQDKINRAKWAEDLKGNPLLNEIMTALKVGYFEKLCKVKKGSGYEDELKDVHESMQNLIRFENYIDRCISAKKVVEQNQQAKKPIDV